MLQALTIRDFAVIEAVEIELGPGLTVVTGETGAGKSVLINALQLILGARARTEVIRSGSDVAQVEALFDLSQAPDVRSRLAEAGLDAGDELVVRRQISRTGRSRVHINGALATANTLAQIADGLVDISGQHAHYSLLKPETHMDLLDRVGGLLSMRSEVEAAHGLVAALDARMADLVARRRERTEREGFIRFQLQELEAAQLESPDEEETLGLRAQRLRNLERLREAAQTAEQLLYAGGDAAAAQIGRALRAAETVAEIDASMSDTVGELRSALAIVEDSAHTIGSYVHGLDGDPRELDALETRLSLFAQLRRKYGSSLSAVIERQRELQDELDQLDGADDVLEALSQERGAAAAKLKAKAQTLSAARSAAARDLSAAVCDELDGLGMSGAQLVVELKGLTAGVAVEGAFFGPRGGDRIEFLLSANPGEEPQQLGRIASGGELSRFMLAVKQVIAHRDPVSTYIFDEVDSGVGGPTAEAIGRKLRDVGRQRQAICITHLHQIASMGDRHLRVEKTVSGDRTRSLIFELEQESRVEELARMLGGSTITETTRAHAVELLHMAAQSEADTASVE